MCISIPSFSPANQFNTVACILPFSLHTLPNVYEQCTWIGKDTIELAGYRIVETFHDTLTIQEENERGKFVDVADVHIKTDMELSVFEACFCNIVDMDRRKLKRKPTQSWKSIPYRER